MSDSSAWASMTPWVNFLQPYACTNPTTRRDRPVASIVEQVVSVRLWFREVREHVVLSPWLPEDADDEATTERELERNRAVQEIRTANALTTPKLRALRDAMEIVGHALPLAPHLWAAFQGEVWTWRDGEVDRTPQQPLQPRAFRDEDLVPAFELVYDRSSVEFNTWLAYVGELLTLRGSNNLDVARQELARVHAIGVAVLRPIDISLSIRRWPGSDEAMTNLLETLESVYERPEPPWFTVTHINLSVFTFSDSVIAGLGRVRALGIEIRELEVLTADASATTHEALVLLSELAESKDAVGGDAVSFPSLRCHLPHEIEIPPLVYAVLLDANCPRTIVVDASLVRATFDWLLSSRVLQAAFSRSHPRNSFRFDLPRMGPDAITALQAAVDILQVTHESPWWEARVDARTPLGKTLLAQHGITNATLWTAILGRDDAVICHPKTGCWVQVPIRVLQGFRKLHSPAAFRVGPQTVTIFIGYAATLEVVLSWFSLCFPVDNVVSLDLQVVCGAKWTRGTVTQILTRCPKLRSPLLSHAEADVTNAFVDGYRDGWCQLEVLSLDTCGVTFLPLVEELAISENAAARMLREVQIGFPEHDEGVFLNTLTAMLVHNRTLQFAEVVLTGDTLKRTESIAAALRPFHREPLALRTSRPMAVQNKLAFLSAMYQVLPSRSARRRLARCLDRGVLTSILSFAAPSLVRLIHLKAQTLCSYARGCGSGWTHYRKVVREEAIEL